MNDRVTADRLGPAIVGGYDFIRRWQLPDGGWGYDETNRQSFVEPTAWAVLALRSDPHAAGALDRGVGFLLGCQNTDGGWPNLPGMPSDLMTARAILALAGLAGADGSVGKALGWICRNELPSGGWGWCYGTTGFLEPATYAILALSAGGRLAGADRLAAYVLGLRCLDGGWCSHVPEKIGFAQPSQLSVTPLGVLALAALAPHADVAEALARSVDLVADCAAREALTTSYTLAMSLWALIEASADQEGIRRLAERATALGRTDGSWSRSVWITALMVRQLTSLRPSG